MIALTFDDAPREDIRYSDASAARGTQAADVAQVAFICSTLCCFWFCESSYKAGEMKRLASSSNVNSTGCSAMPLCDNTARSVVITRPLIDAVTIDHPGSTVANLY